MIIECPVCTTKYDIKAQVPLEGRTVRCAKCGNVWRAMPPVEEETPPQFAAAPAPEESAPVEPEPAQSVSAPINGVQISHEDTPAAGAHSDEGERDEDERETPFGNGKIPDEEIEADAGPAAISEDRESADIRAELENAVSDWRDGEHETEESTGKISWFGNFLRKNGTAQTNNVIPSLGSASGLPSAEPIPFPRIGGLEERKTPAGDDLRTLEEAREAVRGVFASLEPRPSGLSALASPASLGRQQEPGGLDTTRPFSGHHPLPGPAWPEDSGTEHEARSPDWETEFPTDLELAKKASQGAWPLQQESGAEDGSDALDDEPSAESHPWLKAWREGKEEEAEDPDVHLRNALRVHFPEPPEPDESAGQEESPDEAMQRSIIERFAASWKQPQVSSAEEDAGSGLSAEEPGEAVEAEEVFDERLYREIEETRQHVKAQRPHEDRGGLALAAAWGLFVCVGAGIIIGFFAFRDIAAGAVPGLAGLYRTLGLPVTVQPLVFDAVQYEWTVEDYKPVLVIKGAVYNRAQRKVKVPEFVITIKDDDPALDREYPVSLNIDTPDIRPDRRAEFQIELQSPSPSITAVELELRNVR